MQFISRKDAILLYGSVENFIDDLCKRSAGCTFNIDPNSGGIWYYYDHDTELSWSNAGFVQIDGVHASEYITKSIGLPAVLEQVAEEADELSHAALKLARALRGENPTPVSVEEAYEKLLEELVDGRGLLAGALDHTGREINAALLRGVNAAHVEHEHAIDVDPEVVIAVELEEALNTTKKFNEKMYQISQVLAI